MSARAALWREVLCLKETFNSKALEVHVAQIKKFHPETLTHVRIKRGPGDAMVSLAYGNKPHGLFGETVVAQSRVPAGVWVGTDNEHYVLVCWEQGVVQYEIRSDSPEAVAAIILPNGLPLFYTDMDQEALGVCFKSAEAAELELGTFVCLEPINDVINKLSKKESMPRLLMGALVVFLIVGVMAFYGLKKEPIIEVSIENPLIPYQQALHSPLPATILHQMQQAYWVINDLGGWNLDVMRYTPGNGITLTLTTSEPHQDYLHRWLEARPFEVMVKETNKITLRWALPIPTRNKPKRMATNENQHLWMMDTGKSWLMDYSNHSTNKHASGYTVETFILTIREPTLQVFDVLDWLLAHHQDTQIRSIELNYAEGVWAGQVELSLFMQTQKDTSHAH